MNRYILFITVIVCVGIVSCGTQRHLSVQQEEDAFYSGSGKDSSSLSLSERRILDRMMSEEVGKLTLQDIVVEHEIYSEPDSLGRQYLTEKITAKVNTDIQETGRRTAEESSGTTVRKDSTGVMTDTVYTASSTVAVAEEKTGLTWWQKALIWAGAAAICMAAVWVTIKIARLWK